MSRAMFDISTLPPNIPALPPPPGTRSNFVDPQTLSAGLIAINVVFLLLALIFASIRFYVRTRMLKSLWWDDWTILIATLGSVCHSVMILLNIRLGYGRHMWDIRANTFTIPHVAQLTSLAIIYPISICFVKLSIGLLYLRVFDHVKNRPLRWAIYFIMALCTLFYTANVAVEIAAEVKCSDALASLQDEFCEQASKLVSVVTGAFNSATDLYLLLLPIPVIARLKMTRRKKFGVLAALGAGGIACVVSIIRLGWVVKHYHVADILYQAALTTEMTTVEINIAIVAASMVVMPKLAKLPIFESSTYSSLWSRLVSSSRDHKEPSDSLSSHTPSKASLRYRSSSKDLVAVQHRLVDSNEVPQPAGQRGNNEPSTEDTFEMRAFPENRRGA